MKVGILTFPNSKSYGAVLQMLALYQTCRDLGYDTQIINYHNAWMKQEKHLEKNRGQNNMAVRTRRQLTNLLHLTMKTGFTRFEKQMNKVPKKAFSDKGQLREIAGNYGAVICGSDQVWNPDITNFDLSYFLDFCGSKTARISYAPSFGVESLPDAFAEKVRAELEKFQNISVREDSGGRIIRDLTGQDATLVIDPTLLLDEQQWQTYEQVHPQAKGEYILYYTVRSSRTLWRHCLELAKKTNLKILRIGSNVISKQFKKNENADFVCDVSPAQWLYLVHNARYVVTNSFHGTAFSVNYRKDFYVEFSSLTNSRLSNIIRLLSLDNCVLKENVQIAPAVTDYGKAEAVLPKMKEDSIAFLRKALKKAAEECGE